MKKLTFTCIFLISVIVALSIFAPASIVLAKDNIKKTSTANYLPLSSYDPIDDHLSNTHRDASIVLPFSSSGLTADLTSSFSNIINMQIFTGLNK
jgi:hypothetical protein